MINRRGFLSFIPAAAAIAADPERLLWVPGKKLISIPAITVCTVETKIFQAEGIISYNFIVPARPVECEPKYRMVYNYLPAEVIT
jgi:hypothetical protein